MMRKLIYFVAIFFLFQSPSISADKSKIPLCYLYPEIFDKELNSYEEYVVKTCFETFKDHLNGKPQLSREDFLNKISEDKDFERFIYLYVLIREYWFADVGTVINEDYTPSLNESIFFDYLVWGAQSGNYYAYLINLFHDSTDSVDENLIESIKGNKYSILFTLDMGMDTYLEDQEKFFNTYTIDDYHGYFWKSLYLRYLSNYKFELKEKEDAIKYLEEGFNLKVDLPEGFYHQSKLNALGSLSINNFILNNLALSQYHSERIFKFFNLDPRKFKNNLKQKDITPNFYDVRSFLCEVSSMLFMTEAFFSADIDVVKELNQMRSFYPNCFVNAEYAELRIGEEETWWGLVTSWYEEYDLSYSLLHKSKLPLHHGNAWSKRNFLITPAFFNYSALSAIKKNKYNEAEEFLYHAEDSYDKNESPNNFQSLFSSLIKAKLVQSKGKNFTAYKLLNDIREEVLAQETDFGDGYYLDEDINIFIKVFLDLTFQLKSISDDYFVDPLFLFELKNLIFQSDNLLNLKKNNTESDYTKAIDEFQKLRDRKTEIENIILKSTDDDIFYLSKEIDTLEDSLAIARNEILSLKSNLKFFYGSSKASYQELQSKISEDDAILFYNFSISSFQTVVLTKEEVKLYSDTYGRNKVIKLVEKIRSSLKLENFSDIFDLKEYDFESSKILYEKILRPLEIQKFKNIYTFSNEVLNSIPLQILVSKYDVSSRGWNKYISANWLNKMHSFAIIESLSHEKKELQYKKNFVGFGDPDLSLNPSFNDLPNTRDELISLAQASGGSSKDLYLRKDANLENFRKMLQSGAERVVIATHAFPANSFKLTKESGIVISSNLDEKNFVTASEIAQFDVNAEWVVLSACDTGLNNLNYSKNYSSISKAFLAAGVSSVLISNWSIETTSTSRLTREIFDNVWIDNEISKHKALNNASESLRLDFSKDYYGHPAFWGAFSIVYASI